MKNQSPTFYLLIGISQVFVALNPLLRILDKSATGNDYIWEGFLFSASVLLGLFCGYKYFATKKSSTDMK